MKRRPLSATGAALPLLIVVLSSQAAFSAGSDLCLRPSGPAEAREERAHPTLARAHAALSAGPRANLSGAAQDGLARVRGLIASGDLVLAVIEADGLPDGRDGRVARVESRFWAGDLSGAMSAAREALNDHPRDPQLLLLASELATQLLLPEEGLRHAEALQSEAGNLTGELEAFYAGRAHALRQEAEQGLEWQVWVQGAERRTRGLAVAAVGLILVATAALGLRRTPRGRAIED